MATIELVTCEICGADARLDTNDPIHYTNWSIPGNLRTAMVCSKECKQIVLDQANLDIRKSKAKSRNHEQRERHILTEILGMFEFSSDPVVMHRIPDEPWEVHVFLSRIEDLLDRRYSQVGSERSYNE